MAKTGRPPKMTAAQAQEALNRYLTGERPEEIAPDYKVHSGTIMNIVRGTYWKNLDRPPDIQDILARRQFYKNTHKEDLPPLTDHQMNIIIGSLLGDGWMRKPNGPYADSAFHKEQKHLEHIQWVLDELKPYSRKKIFVRKITEKLSVLDGKIIRSKSTPSDETKYQYQMGTTTHSIFTALRKKWYNNSVKKVPEDLRLNHEILSIWYVDDGYTVSGYRRCGLSTQGYTFDEVDFLRCLLETDLGLKGNVVRTKYKTSKRPGLLFCGQNYDRFMAMVSPLIIWSCFKYKIEHVPRVNRVLTDDKKEQISKLRGEGKTYSQIGAILDIDPTTALRFMQGGRKSTFQKKLNQ